MTIWVVVADSSKARILSAENTKSPLQEYQDFVHTASRLKEQELVSDGPGRGSNGNGNHHGVGNEKDAHQHEAEVFAREVCEHINKNCHGKDLRKLYLVAPPRFLGLMRKSLSKNACGILVKEIDKDLSSQSLPEISKYLAAHL